MRLLSREEAAIFEQARFEEYVKGKPQVVDSLLREDEVWAREKLVESGAVEARHYSPGTPLMVLIDDGTGREEGRKMSLVRDLTQRRARTTLPRPPLSRPRSVGRCRAPLSRTVRPVASHHRSDRPLVSPLRSPRSLPTAAGDAPEAKVVGRAGARWVDAAVVKVAANGEHELKLAGAAENAKPLPVQLHAYAASHPHPHPHP